MCVQWRDASAYAGAGYLVDHRRSAHSAFDIYLHFKVYKFFCSTHVIHARWYREEWSVIQLVGAPDVSLKYESSDVPTWLKVVQQ